MKKDGKKRSRFGSTTTVMVGGLTIIMLMLWYVMHSMVATPPSQSNNQASSSSSSSSGSSGQKLIRGSPTPHAVSQSMTHNNILQPIDRGIPSLSEADVKMLSDVLGPKASNFTTGHFITIPGWVTKDPEAGIPPPPCLYSQLTKYNVYLFEDGWRDATQVEEGTLSQCPLPKGGQMPLRKKEEDGGKEEDSVPEVSVVLAFRNMATDTIRSIISVLHCARQVKSIEILILDIASK
jgi:hypothetical protein